MGVTLVEVMIATAVLLGVIGGVIGSLIQARFLTRAAEHQAYALQIARSNLEALRRSFGYADPALSPNAQGTTHTNMASDMPQVLMSGSRLVDVTYIPSYTVTQTDLGNGILYKTVNFTVTWNEPTFGRDMAMSVNADTVIASVMDR